MKCLRTGFVLILIAISAIPNQTQANPILDTLHLNAKDSFNGFELFEGKLDEYDVFINGENHTFLDANSKLWVKMFKYLHQNAGVRNIIIEYGYASGWLINEYLQTGDSNLFNTINQYSFEQYAEAYKELMEYNKTLDSNNKIYLTGIDLERGVNSATKVLSMQLPDSIEPHDSIGLHIESLKSLVSYNDQKLKDPMVDYNYTFYYYGMSYSLKATMDRIIANFENHEDHYKDYLGDKFDLFKKILLGMKDLNTYQQYGAENSTHQFVYRERYMHAQFLKEYEQHDGKFFGQFGRCHSAQNNQTANTCNWYNFKSLANRMIQKPDHNGDSVKVFTSGIFYANQRYAEDELNGMQSHIDSIFKKLAKGRVALYDLPADSALYSRLSGMFNYMILCSYNPNPEYIYGGNKSDYSSYGDTKFSILFSEGIHQLDLKDLNMSLGGEHTDKIIPDMTYLGIQLNVGTKGEVANSNTYFGIYLPQEFDINDSLTGRIKGFMYKSLIGFNTFPNANWIDFTPGVGIGFNRFKMTITETTESPNILNGYLGTQRSHTLKNPAIVLDLYTQLTFHISRFSFGSTVGYSYDISSKKWRSGGEKLEGAPETSFNGIYYTLNVGFNFLDSYY